MHFVLILLQYSKSSPLPLLLRDVTTLLAKAIPVEGVHSFQSREDTA